MKRNAGSFCLLILALAGLGGCSSQPPAKESKKAALDKIQGKAAREALRRDARAAQDAASLSGLIYPQRHLQERLYSILPFLAKHGLGLVDQIYDAIQLDCPDHRMMVV